MQYKVKNINETLHDIEGSEATYWDFIRKESVDNNSVVFTAIRRGTIVKNIILVIAALVLVVATILHLLSWKTYQSRAVEIQKNLSAFPQSSSSTPSPSGDETSISALVNNIQTIRLVSSICYYIFIGTFIIIFGYELQRTCSRVVMLSHATKKTVRFGKIKPIPIWSAASSVRTPKSTTKLQESLLFSSTKKKERKKSKIPTKPEMEKDGQLDETTKPLQSELIECEEKLEFEKPSSSRQGSSGNFLPVGSAKKNELSKSELPSKSGVEKGGHAVEEAKFLSSGLIESEEILKTEEALASEQAKSEKSSNIKKHAQPGKVSEKSSKFKKSFASEVAVFGKAKPSESKASFSPIQPSKTKRSSGGYSTSSSKIRSPSGYKQRK